MAEKPQLAQDISPSSIIVSCAVAVTPVTTVTMATTSLSATRITEAVDCTIVPVGWKRSVQGGAVIYLSPSNHMLHSEAEVRQYLLRDGTCKCGLECPLVVPRVFNFDPKVPSQSRTVQEAMSDGALTKLCNHKRKVIALSVLQHSGLDVRASLSPPTHGCAFHGPHPPGLQPPPPAAACEVSPNVVPGKPAKKGTKRPRGRPKVKPPEKMMELQHHPGNLSVSQLLALQGAESNRQHQSMAYNQMGLPYPPVEHMHNMDLHQQQQLQLHLMRLQQQQHIQQQLHLQLQLQHQQHLQQGMGIRHQSPAGMMPPKSPLNCPTSPPAMSPLHSPTMPPHRSPLSMRGTPSPAHSANYCKSPARSDLSSPSPGVVTPKEGFFPPSVPYGPQHMGELSPEMVGHTPNVIPLASNVLHSSHRGHKTSTQTVCSSYASHHSHGMSPEHAQGRPPDGGTMMPPPPEMSMGPIPDPQLRHVPEDIRAMIAVSRLAGLPEQMRNELNSQKEHLEIAQSTKHIAPPPQKAAQNKAMIMEQVNEKMPSMNQILGPPDAGAFPASVLLTAAAKAQLASQAHQNAKASSPQTSSANQDPVLSKMGLLMNTSNSPVMSSTVGGGMIGSDFNPMLHLSQVAAGLSPCAIPNKRPASRKRKSSASKANKTSKSVRDFFEETSTSESTTHDSVITDEGSIAPHPAKRKSSSSSSTSSIKSPIQCLENAVQNIETHPCSPDVPKGVGKSPQAPEEPGGHENRSVEIHPEQSPARSEMPKTSMLGRKELEGAVEQNKRFEESEMHSAASPSTASQTNLMLHNQHTGVLPTAGLSEDEKAKQEQNWYLSMIKNTAHLTNAAGGNVNVNPYLQHIGLGGAFPGQGGVSPHLAQYRQALLGAGVSPQAQPGHPGLQPPMAAGLAHNEGLAPGHGIHTLAQRANLEGGPHHKRSRVEALTQAQNALGLQHRIDLLKNPNAIIEGLTQAHHQHQEVAMLQALLQQQQHLQQQMASFHAQRSAHGVAPPHSNQGVPNNMETLAAVAAAQQSAHITRTSQAKRKRSKSGRDDGSSKSASRSKSPSRASGVKKVKDILAEAREARLLSESSGGQVDAIYKAVVDSAKGGVKVTIAKDKNDKSASSVSSKLTDPRNTSDNVLIPPISSAAASSSGEPTCTVSAANETETGQPRHVPTSASHGLSSNDQHHAQSAASTSESDQLPVASNKSHRSRHNPESHSNKPQDTSPSLTAGHEPNPANSSTPSVPCPQSSKNNQESNTSATTKDQRLPIDGALQDTKKCVGKDTSASQSSEMNHPPADQVSKAAARNLEGINVSSESEHVEKSQTISEETQKSINNENENNQDLQTGDEDASAFSAKFSTDVVPGKPVDDRNYTPSNLQNDPQLEAKENEQSTQSEDGMKLEHLEQNKPTDDSNNVINSEVMESENCSSSDVLLGDIKQQTSESVEISSCSHHEDQIDNVMSVTCDADNDKDKIGATHSDERAQELAVGTSPSQVVTDEEDVISTSVENAETMPNPVIKEPGDGVTIPAQNESLGDSCITESKTDLVDDNNENMAMDVDTAVNSDEIGVTAPNSSSSTENMKELCESDNQPQVDVSKESEMEAVVALESGDRSETVSDNPNVDDHSSTTQQTQIVPHNIPSSSGSITNSLHLMPISEVHVLSLQNNDSEQKEGEMISPQDSAVEVLKETSVANDSCQEMGQCGSSELQDISGDNNPSTSEYLKTTQDQNITESEKKIKSALPETTGGSESVESGNEEKQMETEQSAKKTMESNNAETNSSDVAETNSSDVAEINSSVVAEINSSDVVETNSSDVAVIHMNNSNSNNSKQASSTNAKSESNIPSKRTVSDTSPTPTINVLPNVKIGESPSKDNAKSTFVFNNELCNVARNTEENDLDETAEKLIDISNVQLDHNQSDLHRDTDCQRSSITVNPELLPSSLLESSNSHCERTKEISDMSCHEADAKSPGISSQMDVDSIKCQLNLSVAEVGSESCDLKETVCSGGLKISGLEDTKNCRLATTEMPSRSDFCSELRTKQEMESESVSVSNISKQIVHDHNRNQNFDGTHSSKPLVISSGAVEMESRKADDCEQIKLSFSKERTSKNYNISSQLSGTTTSDDKMPTSPSCHNSSQSCVKSPEVQADIRVAECETSKSKKVDDCMQSDKQCRSELTQSRCEDASLKSTTMISDCNQSDKLHPGVKSKVNECLPVSQNSEKEDVSQNSEKEDELKDHYDSHYTTQQKSSGELSTTTKALENAQNDRNIFSSMLTDSHCSKVDQSSRYAAADQREASSDSKQKEEVSCEKLEKDNVQEDHDGKCLKEMGCANEREQLECSNNDNVQFKGDIEQSETVEMCFADKEQTCNMNNPNDQDMKREILTADQSLGTSASVTEEDTTESDSITSYEGGETSIVSDFDSRTSEVEKGNYESDMMADDGRDCDSLEEDCPAVEEASFNHNEQMDCDDESNDCSLLGKKSEPLFMDTSEFAVKKIYDEPEPSPEIVENGMDMFHDALTNNMQTDGEGAALMSTADKETAFINDGSSGLLHVDTTLPELKFVPSPSPSSRPETRASSRASAAIDGDLAMANNIDHDHESSGPTLRSESKENITPDKKDLSDLAKDEEEMDGCHGDVLEEMADNSDVQDTDSLCQDLDEPESPEPITISPSPSIPRELEVGDLVWGQIRGYPSWPGKLVSDADVKTAAKRECGKKDGGKVWVMWFGDHSYTLVESVKLKTLSEGLEAHHRARRKNRRGRKMNSGLEAAIQEAMLELDKQAELATGNPASSTAIKPSAAFKAKAKRKRLR